MLSFVRKFAGVVFGVLSGFDRLMFRGHLRELAYPAGLHRYCNFNGVKLVDFGKHAEQLTAQLVAAAEAPARQLGRRWKKIRRKMLTAGKSSPTS